MFQINDAENQQNVKLWGTEHLSEHKLMSLNSLGIMKWGALLKELVLGPYIF